MAFVQVAEIEGREPIELPTEEDGSLLQSTLQSQYPGSSGLKYRNEGTNNLRGIRANVERSFPPSSENGWGNRVYFCVFPKDIKRKHVGFEQDGATKTMRIEPDGQHCDKNDLIVLNLPWSATEETLREYFGKFGDLIMVQVKKDINTGQSKGYGFIRFACPEVQKAVLYNLHCINGRQLKVQARPLKGILDCEDERKVHVSRCTADISSSDLKEYFSQFGEVESVFMPVNFRAFAFVTFSSASVARSLCGEDHIIKGVSVHVSTSTPKSARSFNTRIQIPYRDKAPIQPWTRAVYAENSTKEESSYKNSFKSFQNKFGRTSDYKQYGMRNEGLSKDDGDAGNINRSLVGAGHTHRKVFFSVGESYAADKRFSMQGRSNNGANKLNEVPLSTQNNYSWNDQDLAKSINNPQLTTLATIQQGESKTAHEQNPYINTNVLAFAFNQWNIVGYPNTLSSYQGVPPVSNIAAAAELK